MTSSLLHLTNDELELYLMGHIPDVVELERTEEHMIGCPERAERAEAMEDYITAMKDALKKANAEGEGEKGCPA